MVAIFIQLGQFGCLYEKYRKGRTMQALYVTTGWFKKKSLMEFSIKIGWVGPRGPGFPLEKKQQKKHGLKTLCFP